VPGHYSAQNQTVALRVAVLDSQQGILDGYHYRFDPLPNITIVAEALNAADFEAGLERFPADIALMERQAPVAAQNPAPYPILHVIPRLLDRYPNLAVLVFAARADPHQIHSVMMAGASGYIVKQDAAIYPVLPQVLVSVYQGGVYYSPAAQIAFRQADPNPGRRRLLTQRQLEALSLCAAYSRYTISDIAAAMGVRPSTARNLLSQVYGRLEVTSRMEAVMRAEKLGLLPYNRNEE
jgi:DNA-binding NarL/FixJ family response regulator